MLTPQEKMDLVTADVTLNGERAVVMGWKCEHGSVGSLESPLRVPFAWETIARVVANGGHFKA